MLEIFIQTFFLYFIVIDPLGNTPLFLAVTQNMSSQQRVKTALSATIIASIILLFFAFLGSTLLSYLNISFPAFTIGGGIILLIISMEMLFDKRQQRKEDDIDFNTENVSLQKDLHLLQGIKRTWFCGSYFGYGFHEDGLKSSIDLIKNFKTQ